MKLLYQNHEMEQAKQLEDVGGGTFPFSPVVKIKEDNASGECLSGRKGVREYTIGRHLILDFYGTAHPALSSISTMEKLLRDICEENDLHLLSINLHKFGVEGDENGISGMAVISESYIGVHTWPELGILTMDYYVCEVETVKRTGVATVERIRRMLAAEECDMMIIDRGGLIDGQK